MSPKSSSDPFEVEGWKAYGGGAGDRFEAAQLSLAQAQARVAGLDVSEDPLTQADAYYRLGRAYTWALHLPAPERFANASQALLHAADVGDAHGNAAQRARLWTGVGTGYKNRIPASGEPPESRVGFLESAVRAHEKGLMLARESGEDELIAEALSGLALALQYRIAGDKTRNVERSAEAIDASIGIRRRLGDSTKLAIALTSAGVIWAEHPDRHEGMPMAIRRYREASRFLDADAYPAHARRLGRSGGRAALYLGLWDEAAAMYSMANRGMERLVASTSGPQQDKERIEFGDASGRHIYALARAARLHEAWAQANSYRQALHTRTPEPLSFRSVGTAGLMCGFLVATPAGTLALMRTDAQSTAIRANSITEHSAGAGMDEHLIVLRFDDLTSDDLEAALGRPGRVAAHGPAVASQLLNQHELGERTIGPAVMDLLARWAEPMTAHASELAVRRLLVVPFAALADAPLQGAWTVAQHTAPAPAPQRTLDKRHSGTRTDVRRLVPHIDPAGKAMVPLSVSPGLALAQRVSTKPPNTDEPRLVTIAITQSASGLTPAARIESDQVGAAFPGVVMKLHDEQATVSAVIDALRHATHVHFAGHGTFDPLQPRLSYIECHDGSLTLDELRNADCLASARLMVAAACSIGASDTMRIPDQASGLAAELMGGWGCALVAPIRAVFDETATVFSVEFSRRLWANGHEGDPAEALASTQHWMRSVNESRLREWLATCPGLDVDSRLRPGITADGTWIGRPDIWAPFVAFGA